MLGYVWHTHASRSPSSPSVTLSWPHNVTIRGTEVERGRCLFVRNSSAKQRKKWENTERFSQVLDDYSESGYEAEFIRQFANDEWFLTVRVLRSSQKHCHFSYRSSTHTQHETRARAHTSERGREREKGVSRVAAIKRSSRYELNTRLLAAKACWPLTEGEVSYTVDSASCSQRRSRDLRIHSMRSHFSNLCILFANITAKWYKNIYNFYFIIHIIIS